MCSFSGLRPEDLDMQQSRVWLASKKTVLQKLRYLVDSGCVYVGSATIETSFQCPFSVGVYVGFSELHAPLRCIRFVGHGLAQDFRIMNLYVPNHQIIDTVELFRLPGKRYLSLKFLAATLLNMRIQRDTHDSIEDAQTALRLYKYGATRTVCCVLRAFPNSGITRVHSVLLTS